ncbi:hypothetical protein C922_00273 [Plasmodium inui San Antonio 1]|uniref:Uncharacterized protein n=1 Tax=Plasmodium inui San Antonio 1 TaxID=1237626 RepID=W7ACH2_9APIC|nr:hypothetical protein C922_00273 [Plasmodium inui San Antonio 1]EUD69410.1 hypothetical protein C922_00273 [Plasmodium inui San Antonio 1]
MTVKNNAKNKKAKSNVNNSGVHNRSSVTESREERWRIRSTISELSAILASSYIDPVGNAKKGKDSREVIDTKRIDKKVLDQKGIVKQGIVKQGIVKQGIVKQGIVKQGIVKQGIVKQGVDQKGIDKKSIDKKGIDKAVIDKAVIDKEVIDKEDIDKKVQAITTSLSKETLKQSNENDRASEEVSTEPSTQDCTTVHDNDTVSGTQIGDDNGDVQSIAELSTCQTTNEKDDAGGDRKDENGEQHSLIPPQGEDSSIPKGEKTNPIKDQNEEKEHDNPVAQEEVAFVRLTRSRSRTIRNNKNDIFSQEKSTRSVTGCSNTKGSNRKKEKMEVEKNLVDNTSQPNCKEQRSSTLANEEDKVANNVKVSNSTNADALGENTHQLLNIKPVPSLTKNEEVAQKPDHCYSNVLGNDVLADAAENDAHNLCIPLVSNSTTDDNANQCSAPTSAVKSIDTSSCDLSVVNQNMCNGPDEKGIVKAKREQSTVEIAQEFKAVDLDSSVHSFKKRRSPRFKSKGKAGWGGSTGRDNLNNKKVENIEQKPDSINNNDLLESDEKNILPNVTDQGGITATPVSEDADQSVVDPFVDTKKTGKNKAQNSSVKEGSLDENLNENAKENKSSVKPLFHDSRRRRRNDGLSHMSKASGDADTVNLHIPPRESSVLEEKHHLPHLEDSKEEINSSAVDRSHSPPRRKVKDEKNKEFLDSENSTVDVATSADTNSGNVVSPSSGSHDLSQADHLDYACGRNLRKRKCTQEGEHGTDRKKSRGGTSTPVNNSTNADCHKSDTSNVLLESEGANADSDQNSSNHCDSDSKRLFPNETFQIKEEFMNNVNSLNTVFNFNEEFLKFLKKISKVDDIDYDVMLSFLGEVQGKLAKDMKQQFPPHSLHSHNVDEAVYAMEYIVEILNNNNEILNKLNQIEYKFYYDYLRKRSVKKGNKRKNYDYKIENEIALNIARIPRDINNECCVKIQSNHLNDDNTVNNESTKSFNGIDDEEERRLNELLYCANKEMDDIYMIRTCADMYFMNYNEEDNFRHINQRSLNLKNDNRSIMLPNSSVVGERPHHERGGTVRKRSRLSHPTGAVAQQVTQWTGEKRQHGEETEKHGSLVNGQPHNTNTFAKKATGKDRSTERRMIIRSCSGEVQEGEEGPPVVAPKCTDKTDHNAEKEKISKRISKKMSKKMMKKMSKKINLMQNEKNINKNDFLFKYGHKFIKQNNVDFVCDEFNKLIRHTLKNEDLFYSNYSQGKYKNVNEESLFKHYISTKLYNSTNLLDRYRGEQKEGSILSEKAFIGRQLEANEGVSGKVDEREETLIQRYADYFRQLNDVSSRGRNGECGKSGKGGQGGKDGKSGKNGKSGKGGKGAKNGIPRKDGKSGRRSDHAQLGHSTNDQLEAHYDATGALLSDADDNTEKMCGDHEKRSPYWDVKKDHIVGCPKWENNYNQNGGGKHHWTETHLSNNSNNMSIVSSTIGEISYGVSALSSEDTTRVREKHSDEADDNTSYVSTNLQGSVKTEAMDRLEKHERRNDDSEKKQQNNGFSSEERMHDGPKGTYPQSASMKNEGAQKKDAPEKKSFWFAKIVPFFKKIVKGSGSIVNNNPDDVDNAGNADKVENTAKSNNADNVCDLAKQTGDRDVKKETDAEFETHPSGVGATEKGLADGKSKIDRENAKASIERHDEETKVCAHLEGNNNSLDISNRSEKDEPEKSATDVSLCHYGSGITEDRTSPRTGAHALRHRNETLQKNIDTLLKDTFYSKDNEFMSINRDRTQKEILNCLRIVSQIKKIFFDECSKMINDQIYDLEKNFRIPNFSLSILENSFDYNDGK